MVHGVRAFVPVLQEQDAAHVVNTSSVFGLFAGSLGAYGASKHAVVALSESLHFQLREAGSHIGVTVLCPSAVRTTTGITNDHAYQVSSYERRVTRTEN